MVSEKKHLTHEGLEKIIAIISSINLGLSDELKNKFSVIPAYRPDVLNQEIPHPYWLSGFVCGDGCFMVSVSKSTYNKTGYAVRLFFSISQDKRDTQWMKKIIDYLECGNWQEKGSKSYGEVVVSKFEDIQTKIIPFFNQYSMYGDKSLDFDCFKDAAEFIMNKHHLINQGLNNILNIKKGMN